MIIHYSKKLKNITKIVIGNLKSYFSNKFSNPIIQLIELDPSKGANKLS